MKNIKSIRRKNMQVLALSALAACCVIFSSCGKIDVNAITKRPSNESEPEYSYENTSGQTSVPDDSSLSDSSAAETKKSKKTTKSTKKKSDSSVTDDNADYDETNYTVSYDAQGSSYTSYYTYSQSSSAWSNNTTQSYPAWTEPPATKPVTPAPTQPVTTQPPVTQPTYTYTDPPATEPTAPLPTIDIDW